MVHTDKERELAKTINELIETGEHLVDIIREYYFGGRFKPSSHIGDHYKKFGSACQKAIENKRMKHYFERLKSERIELAGIHYLKKITGTFQDRWLPILYQTPTDASKTYKNWLQMPGSALEQHLCFCANRLEHKEDYIIAIKSPFFKQTQVNKLIRLMETKEQVKDKFNLQSFNTESLSGVFKTNYVEFNKNFKQKNKVLSDLKNESRGKIFSSFLLGARAQKELYTGEQPPNAYFYNNPDLGGIAFVSATNFTSEDLELYKSLFRRLIYLVGIFDGFVFYWVSPGGENPYKRHKIIENSLVESLQSALREYLDSLQLPKDILKDKIYLESEPFTPIYVVKRIGNRKRNQIGLTLVIRLGIKNEDAFNFIYLDNAMVLNKLEEFLNGWIKGFLASSRRKVSIDDAEKTLLTSCNTKVRLDVYVSPVIRDIEARKSNPYIIKKFNYDELRIEKESNFDYWNRNILNKTGKIPAVVYRYSELVGPSIFLGEIASAIINHFWTCTNGCRRKNEPLKVLDLFSGTSSAEATILKNCGEDIKIHFVGLDLNPYLLSDAYNLTRIPPPLLAKVKSHTHVIPTDIFEILSYVEKDPKPRSFPGDIYSKGYDLILSDPPHFLSLDFLYQKIRWIKKENDEIELKEDTLMRHLAKEARVKCFVFYFGHKEKEWLNFFIHRVLSKEEWPDVWSILIGDERIVLCFNKFEINRFQKYEGISLPGCKNKIIENLYKIANVYNFNPRGLKMKIYDNYYRAIPCDTL